jgi:hypothetical protein
MNVNLRFLDSTDRKVIAILCALPLAMAAVNDSWLYTVSGWLDPWYNVGYFIHYNDPTFLNDYYKIARLSWIIPGYIIYYLFNPLVANFILHIGALILSTCSLYLGLKRSLNARAAFIAAAMLTVYFPFHGSGGWDYQTTPSGAYYLIAFALISYAAQSPSRNRLLFLAGLSLGATLHANVLFINLIPLLVAHYLTLIYVSKYQPIDRRLLISGGVNVALGILAITVLLGTINYLVGRDFIFFKILFRIVTTYVADVGNMKQWWLPWSSLWFALPVHFSYLAAPFSVFCVSIAALIRFAGTRTSKNLVAISLIGQFVLVVTIWIFWQSIGHVALQPDYFAYPLIPAMFCAVGGIASLVDRPDQDRAPALFLSLFAFVLALPLSASPAFLKLSTNPAILFLLISLSTALAVLLLMRKRLETGVLLLSALLFGFANYQSARTSGGEAIYGFNQSCKSNRQIFEGLISANQFFSQYVTNVAKIAVWWDKSEVLRSEPDCSRGIVPIAMSMTSFGSTYLAPPWDGMPAIANLPDTSLKLNVGSFIAIPTNNGALVEQMMARYKEAGIMLSLAGKTVIRSRPTDFSLYLLAVQSSK